MNPPKSKPTFSSIDKLRPDTSGWNLVVKVRAGREWSAQEATGIDAAVLANPWPLRSTHWHAYW